MNVDVGRRIADLRRDHKIQQKDLAERIGVTAPQLSRWESGVNAPSITVIQNICDALGINIADFFGGGTVANRRTEAVPRMIVDAVLYLPESKQLEVLALAVKMKEESRKSE